MSVLNKVAGVILFLLIAGTAYAQEVITLPQGSANGIVVLPLTYNTDKGFTDLGEVKTGRIAKSNKFTGFKPQMEALGDAAVKKGGNVVKITRINDVKQRGIYKFRAEVYRADDLSRLIQQIIETKKKPFAGEKCAYITIYRPAYSGGFNDEAICDIVVNDTLKLEMNGNSKYVLKVTKEGSVKVEIRHKSFTQDLKVNVQFGKDYYVRNYMNFPGSHKFVQLENYNLKVPNHAPYMDSVSQYQGAIESSMITQVVVSKKI